MSEKFVGPIHIHFECLVSIISTAFSTICGFQETEVMLVQNCTEYDQKY